VTTRSGERAQVSGREEWQRLAKAGDVPINHESWICAGNLVKDSSGAPGQKCSNAPNVARLRVCDARITSEIREVVVLAIGSGRRTSLARVIFRKPQLWLLLLVSSSAHLSLFAPFWLFVRTRRLSLLACSRLHPTAALGTLPL
jgi:hypothetical protein